MEVLQKVMIMEISSKRRYETVEGVHYRTVIHERMINGRRYDFYRSTDKATGLTRFVGSRCRDKGAHTSQHHFSAVAR